MNNNEFYYQKPKKCLTIYLLFIAMFISITYFSINYYSYDKKEIIGINDCHERECDIKITLDYEEIKILDQKPIILYESKKYQIKEIVYGDMYLSNNIPVSDIILKTDHITKTNIIDFKLLYNKQRIIKKIKNIIERN